MPKLALFDQGADSEVVAGDCPSARAPGGRVRSLPKQKRLIIILASYCCPRGSGTAQRDFCDRLVASATRVGRASCWLSLLSEAHRCPWKNFLIFVQ